MDKQNAVHLYNGILSLFSCQIMLDSFATPWTVACQALLSTGFPRQEYWSRLPFPSPGDLSNPGIEPMSPAMAGGFFTAEPPGKLTMEYYSTLKRSEAHAMRWINLKIIMLSEKQNRCKSDILHVSIYMKCPE